MKTNKKTISADTENLIPILIGVWRRFQKLPGPPDRLQTREFRSVVSAVKALEEKSLNGESLLGQDYFNNPDLLGAYLLYQWMIHYQQGLSLIGELPKTPKRVLDVCSGPIAFGFAALRHGAQEVIAVDRNESALKLGTEVCGRYGLPVSIRKWSFGKSGTLAEGKFDLIIVGHCLEELFPPSKKGWQNDQQTFLLKLLDQLTPDGHLLIVESSFGESNRRVLQLRDDFVKQNVPVQAPCVWRGECPALKLHNTPCYAQREFEKPELLKQIQRASSINLSSLKMSYVIFRNPSSGWPDLHDKKLYRVISPPVEGLSGKRYYLCGTDGKKYLESHVQDHPAQSRAFDYLRRNELLSFSNVLEKQNAIDIIEGSEIRIEAACGKPLPMEFES